MKRIECPHGCGKKVKNLKMHEQYCSALHPERAEPETPSVVESNPDNREMKVAKMLYNEIVRPICDEHAIALSPWEEIDQSDYFKIAGKIIKESS